MERTKVSSQTDSDEVLCTRAVSGDRVAEESLVMRYNRLVRICARPFFLAGGDSEDLIQEGMLGLLKAIREFDSSRDAAFRTFAETCIRNRVRSAVTAAARGKHAPLNDSISFDCAQWRDRPGPAQGSPEELVIDREEQSERLDVLKDRLSKFEAAVLRYYLGGLSYQEIAERTRRPLKSVDNAVQRIRRKVAQQLYSGVISES